MPQAPSGVATPAESSEGEEEQNWEDWQDELDEAFQEEAQSLFDSTRLPSVEAVLQHDSQHHNFSLLAYREKYKVGLLLIIPIIQLQLPPSTSRQEALCLGALWALTDIPACEAQLGDHDIIKLINFIRQLVASWHRSMPTAPSCLPGGQQALE